MTKLYVVRTPFRAHGIFYEVGTIIEDPSSIWLFRSRLGARDIIELEPGGRQNEMWFEYLCSRATKELDARIYQLCKKPLPKGHSQLVKATTQAVKPTTTAKTSPVAKRSTVATKSTK